MREAILKAIRLALLKAFFSPSMRLVSFLMSVIADGCITLGYKAQLKKRDFDKEIRELSND